MTCIRNIALLAALFAVFAAACGDEQFTSVTLAGRGLTMNVANLQEIDGLIYQDTDQQYYSVGPAMEGHSLVAAQVTIWNNRSGRLSLFVDEEAALLGGTNREEARALNPYERRVPLDAPPAALSPHLPFLWGPSDLPQGFNITGWMVFELPDGVEIVRLEWEQVDTLRFPITIS